MDDSELRKAVDSLREFARDTGLGWVLEQVDELRALGRVEARTLRATTSKGQTIYVEEVATKPSGPGRKRTEEFLSTRPLTIREEAMAIVESFQRALVDVDMIAKAAVLQLPAAPDQDIAITEIDFYPDEGAVGESFSTEALRHEERPELARILGELAAEVSS